MSKKPPSSENQTTNTNGGAHIEGSVDTFRRREDIMGTLIQDVNRLVSTGNSETVGTREDKSAVIQHHIYDNYSGAGQSINTRAV